MSQDPRQPVRERETDLTLDDVARQVQPLPGSDRFKVVGLCLLILALCGIFAIAASQFLDDGSGHVVQQQIEQATDSAPEQSTPAESSALFPADPNWDAPRIFNFPIEPDQNIPTFEPPPVQRSTRPPLPSEAELDRQRRLFQVQRGLADLETLAERLSSAIDNWERVHRELLTNETGRRLASQTDLLEQYQALRAQDRPHSENLPRLQGEVTGLLSNRPLVATDVSGVATVEVRLPVLTQEVQQALLQYQTELQSLQQLLDQAATAPLAAITLEVALQQLTAARERERLQQIAEARRQAQLEVERQRQAALQQAAERERLTQEALSPTVLAALKPLTTKDVVQIRDVTPGGLALGERVPQPVPISLSKMRSLGLLDQTQQGMILLAILNSRSWTNRPRWPLQYSATEPALWTRQQHEMIATMQQSLISYGEILVEKGLLAP